MQSKPFSLSLVAQNAGQIQEGVFTWYTALDGVSCDLVNDKFVLYVDGKELSQEEFEFEMVRAVKSICLTQWKKNN